MTAHSPADYRFFHSLRVRYSEIDGQKIVFNSHYLTYLDTAMVEYIRHVIGRNWMELAEKHIFDIALVKITLEFHRPARLDDLLRVYCRVSKLGNSSFTVSFLITREVANADGKEEEAVLSAEGVYVNYNPEKGKSQLIPDDIREKIVRFERI